MATNRTRRPSITSVVSAARTLNNALSAEAERLRDEDPSRNHVTAQELEHLAINVGGIPDRIKAHRRARP